MDVLEAVEIQRRRARVVVWLLAAVAALNAAGLLSGAAQLALLARAASGGIDMAEASANDARHGAIGVAQTAAYVLCAIAWLRWFHRAYGNLTLLGSGRTDHTPGSAVGWWFVPLMNLFRPYQITKELWVRSRAGNDLFELGRDPVPGLLHGWWASWLAMNFLGQALLRLTREAEELAALERMTVLGMTADAVTVVAALAALAIVRRIDADQRAASLGARAAVALS